MKLPISLVRFSVTGANDQYYNYIPLKSGQQTKVNLNFVIHFDQSALDQMKKNKINRIFMSAVPNKDQKSYSSQNIPRSITEEDFLSISFGFSLQNQSKLPKISKLHVSLGYSNSDSPENQQLIFETSIPVKEDR